MNIMKTSIGYQLFKIKFLIKRIPAMSKTLNLVIKLSVILSERLRNQSLIKVASGNKISVIKITRYRNIFCGYYDVSPFCPNNSDLLLLHATSHSAYSSPNLDKSIDLLLYDISNGKWKLIDQTRTWNWQQGSRLQWLDHQRVAYNILHEGEVRCKIKNILTNEETILPVSLNVAYKDRYIFSIDYLALTEGSEYGYPGLRYDAVDRNIYLYNLMENSYSELFSWDELSALAPPGAERLHINHILASPDCVGFVFIFRYWLQGRRYDSLVYFKIASKELRVVIKNQVVSHYTWKDNDMLFAWIDVGGSPGYYMIHINTMKVEMLVPIDDGHPTHISDNKYISDIYTGSRLSGSRLTAFILDVDDGVRVDLVTLSHPTIFDYTNRCDMHISLSSDKRRYQLDSRHMHSQRTVIVGEL